MSLNSVLWMALIGARLGSASGGAPGPGREMWLDPTDSKRDIKIKYALVITIAALGCAVPPDLLACYELVFEPN